MDFDNALILVMARLQRDGRATYRGLQHAFGFDGSLMEVVKEELIFKGLAVDEGGRGLVWTGWEVSYGRPFPVLAYEQAPKSARIAVLPVPPTPPAAASADATATPAGVIAPVAPDDIRIPEPERGSSEAERRQLTVVFCDLVDSTGLSQRLDPEDYRAVVRAYQAAAALVIERYEGYIAQYLGDGLMVYFGYPRAHEHEAQHAVRASLEIVGAMGPLSATLEQQYGVRVAVRVGLHTGPVVIGEMGGGERHEHLAMGDTPNIASRIQGLADPNTVALSAATARLVHGAFNLESLGVHHLKGVKEPMAVARVIGTIDSDERGEELEFKGVPFLVGRDEEVGLLKRRWEQTKEGVGQVVLVSGEAGIGKSALVETLRVRVRDEGAPRVVIRCSPYHTNSALYPVIAHVERLLGLERDGSAEANIAKMEQALQVTRLPLDGAVPLLAALLAVPLPEKRYSASDLSAKQQRQQTLDLLVAWLLDEAERQPVLAIWEDLHWADPSTLELLGLLIEQAPTVRMLHVLTFRPEFTLPWPTRSHITPLTLNRLERPQVEAMIKQLAGGRTLPPEVIEHVVRKTDGVPVFVEELTKMLLESPLLCEEAGAYRLTGSLETVAIPATLQDSLMARLDKLSTAKEVAQLAAVLGREFIYEMLQALTVVADGTLQIGLEQLVKAELLYQRGRPPRARYVFKHALIQDAAYASLLRSTRQQYHRQVAQLLENRFRETIAAEPELIAHHYTEAGCTAQALAYWQQAGEQAVRRSANLEAIGHLTKGLDLLSTLPETPERAKRELMLQIPLGVALTATKGWGAPDVGRAYTRAWQLARQSGDTEHLFPVLRGLWAFHAGRGEHRKAREVGERFLGLVQRAPDPVLLMEANHALGFTLFCLGEWELAEKHLERGIELHEGQDHRALPVFTSFDLGMAGLFYAAFAKWHLGYPDQALRWRDQALALARELDHPFSLAYALFYAAWFHQLRREVTATEEHADALIALANERRFAVYVARGSILRGWARAQQGYMNEATVQMKQSVDAHRATGTALYQPYFLAVLADTYAKAGNSDEALRLLREALALMEETEERFWEPELHRLRGELLLRQAQPDARQAEACLQQALEVARRQRARSLELRAAISLSRLWQSRGQLRPAQQLLSGTFGWFTEGFETADLREAKKLLAELEQQSRDCAKHA